MDVIRYRTDEGVFTGLQVNEGTKYLQIILMDSRGLRIRKVAKTEGRYITPLEYPVKRAVRKFKSAGRRFGITKSARRALAA